MIELAQFHFVRPGWLLAFLPLVLLLWLMLKRKIGNRNWEAFCDRELLPHILIGNERKTRRWATLLTGLCGALSILALAGPVWQKLPQPVFSTQSALVIALDLSRSMDATDVNPSRLARARFKVADILARRGEGETALLVYAGDAFTVTPLTDDAATIELQLEALTTDIIPAQGNRTDRALSKAVELLKQAGAGKGDILLITDEVDIERTEAAAREINNAGYRLSILGIGTPQGAPVTKADGSFLKDQAGQIIIPRLNEEPMRQLAMAGGGRYLKMSVDDGDIRALDQFFSSNLTDGELSETDLATDVWREQGPWLLLALLPLAAMAFRRGVLFGLLIFYLPFPQQAQAFDWDSLWLRSDQRARRVLEEGDPGRAAEIFTDPAWKGAAHYRAGNFDGAISSLEQAEGPENQYNLGNALARKGLYEQAIAAYSKVLEQEPGHEDARYNKELLEKELEKQQQQQQQQAQNQQQQQNQDQQQQDQGQQQQDQNQQSQQQQDQSSDQEQQAQGQSQDEEFQDQSSREETGPERQERLQASSDQVKEEKQATEQWLRRIPDDPGGLLRRKFLYQYQQRQHERVPGEKLW